MFAWHEMAAAKRGRVHEIETESEDQAKRARRWLCHKTLVAPPSVREGAGLAYACPRGTIQHSLAFWSLEPPEGSVVDRRQYDAAGRLLKPALYAGYRCAYGCQRAADMSDPLHRVLHGAYDRLVHDKMLVVPVCQSCENNRYRVMRALCTEVLRLAPSRDHSRYHLARGAEHVEDPLAELAPFSMQRALELGDAWRSGALTVEVALRVRDVTCRLTCHETETYRRRVERQRRRSGTAAAAVPSVFRGYGMRAQRRRPRAVGAELDAPWFTEVAALPSVETATASERRDTTAATTTAGTAARRCEQILDTLGQLAAEMEAAVPTPLPATASDILALPHPDAFEVRSGVPAAAPGTVYEDWMRHYPDDAWLLPGQPTTTTVEPRAAAAAAAATATLGGGGVRPEFPTCGLLELFE